LPFGLLGEYDPAGSKFGIGTLGISTTGYAVAGESLSNTQPSILAYPGGTGMGLEAVAQAGSSSPAIYAQSNGQGDGIDGAANNQQAAAGVLGEDLNNPGTLVDGVLGTTISGGYGVEGTSSDNAVGGVHGLATTGIGVEGDSTSEAGVIGSSMDGPGVYGINTDSGEGSAVTDGSDVGTAGVSPVGDGVYGKSVYARGVYGTSVYGSAADFSNNSITFPTLSLENNTTQTGGMLIEASDKVCSADVCMTLDTSGDLSVAGTITDSKGTFARTRNPSSDLMSYGEEATEPTIEDVGRGELVAGSASVSIAGDFRQTIDGSDYLVFLTPHGDCNGLYIASETASGFVVRESHGGRSTLAFDYRIVAQQYGAHEGRLPHYSTLHPNQRNLELAAIARLGREHPAEPVGAQPRQAILSMKKQQALKLAHDRRRFVPPPVTFMPQAASFSVR
jgi:hypothetical protein